MPRHQFTKEEASAMAKLGNAKRKELNAQRKAMKFTLETLLSKTLRRGDLVNLEDVQNLAEAEDMNVDVQTAIWVATVQRALMGDMQAVQLIRDTVGEKPSDKVQIDQSLTIESWAKNHKVKL